MELLLNILWLLLAVPAVFFWLRTPDPRLQSKGGLSALIVLGCILLLLFPVISASDDLHAMRSEIEESSLSKKIIMHDAAQSPHSSTAWGNDLLALGGHAAILPQIIAWEYVIDFSAAMPELVTPYNGGSRAPPPFLRS